MTSAEKLYLITKELPEPIIAELLDFAEFLKQKNTQEERHAGNQLLVSLKGGLETSKVFEDSPLIIQEKLRNEWN